jgi:hypothetical protein
VGAVRFGVEWPGPEPILAVGVAVPAADGRPLGGHDLLVRLHSI